MTNNPEQLTGGQKEGQEIPAEELKRIEADAEEYWRPITFKDRPNIQQIYIDAAKAEYLRARKLSENRGEPVWVNVSDRLPKKRTNCFVFCHTDLHGGYDYKATRLWTGEKWVDELNARTEPVVRWLDESPSLSPEVETEEGEKSEKLWFMLKYVKTVLERGFDRKEIIDLIRKKLDEYPLYTPSLKNNEEQ